MKAGLGSFSFQLDYLHASLDIHNVFAPPSVINVGYICSCEGTELILCI